MGREATKAIGNPWYEARMEAAKYVKQRLIAYRESDKYIDNLIELQERAEAQLAGIGSPAFSDMPRSGTPSSPDRFTDKIAKLDELKAKVKDQIEQRDNERHYFEKLLSKIKKANQVSVIDESGTVTFESDDGVFEIELPDGNRFTIDTKYEDEEDADSWWEEDDE